MTKINTGLAAVVAKDSQSFTDFGVGVARRQRARKDTAMSEARKLLVEKQAYAPFAPKVNEFMEAEIDKIANSMDLDSGAYTRAVQQYAEYYGQSQAVEKFMRDSAASYQADKEVNHNEAVAALTKKYIKSGSIEELANLASGEMDAEQVLIETPGALNADVVMENRISRFGDIIQQYTTQAKKARNIGGYNMQLEGEEVMAKYKQYIIKDGDNVYVDPAALDDKGFYDIMMSDQRVKAIVSNRLKEEGIEAPAASATVEEKKAYTQQLREELANLMTPFVDYTETKKDRSQTLVNRAAMESARFKNQMELLKAKPTKDGASSEKRNDWYRDLLSFNQKAASYIEGSELTVGALPVDDPRIRAKFGDVKKIVVTNIDIKKGADTPGGGAVRMRIRAADSGSFITDKREDGTSVKSNEMTLYVPLADLKDPERAAIMYQEAYGTKRSDYESSAGVGAGSTTEPAAAGIFEGLDLNTGEFK